MSSGGQQQVLTSLISFQSHFLIEPRRFDIHSKAKLARFKKYHLGDLRLRRTVLGN